MRMLFGTLLAGVLALGGEQTASAQDLPVKTVRIVVPGGAGGGADTATRLFATALEDAAGIQAIVTNQTAGGGVVATQSLHTARPDGATLMVAHAKLHTQEIGGNTELGYGDLTPLGTISEINTAYVARADAPYSTLEELIAYTGEHPDEVVMATQASGTSQVMGNALNAATGGKLRLVDFGSTSKRLPALIGNQAQVSMIPTGIVQQYVDSGDLKALAVINDRSDPALPEVPTAKSQGIEISFPLVVTLYGPPGMSEEVVSAYERAIAKVQDDPAFRDAIIKIGQNPVSMTPEETRAFLEREFEFVKTMTGK